MFSKIIVALLRGTADALDPPAPAVVHAVQSPLRAPLPYVPPHLRPEVTDSTHIIGVWQLRAALRGAALPYATAKEKPAEA